MTWPGCKLALDENDVQIHIFSYISMQTYVVDTHLKRLQEALLMSAHNICFYAEIKKNHFNLKSVLSRAMTYNVEVYSSYSYINLMGINYRG